MTVKNRYKQIMKDIALDAQTPSGSKPEDDDDEFNIDKGPKNVTAE